MLLFSLFFQPRCKYPARRVQVWTSFPIRKLQKFSEWLNSIQNIYNIFLSFSSSSFLPCCSATTLLLPSPLPHTSVVAQRCNKLYLLWKFQNLHFFHIILCVKIAAFLQYQLKKKKILDPNAHNLVISSCLLFSKYIGKSILHQINLKKKRDAFICVFLSSFLFLF